MYVSYNGRPGCLPTTPLEWQRGRGYGCPQCLDARFARRHRAKPRKESCDGWQRAERGEHRGGLRHAFDCRYLGDRPLGPRASRGSGPPAAAGPGEPLAAFHADGLLRRAPLRAGDRPWRGLLRLRRARQALPRRPLGAVLRQRRPRPGRARRGSGGAGSEARLLHELELCPPTRDRTGRAHRRPGSRKPQPGVLHLRRLGGGRVGLEARQGLPPRTWRHEPPQARLAQPGLPRRFDGRPDRDRPAAAARALRTADARRRARAEHELVPLERGPRPAVGSRRDRGGDRVRGPEHGRRGDPRARPERRRLLHTAGGLLPTSA